MINKTMSFNEAKEILLPFLGHTTGPYMERNGCIVHRDDVIVDAKYQHIIKLVNYHPYPLGDTQVIQLIGMFTPDLLKAFLIWMEHYPYFKEKK